MMSFWSLHVNSFIHFPLTGISYTKRLVGRRWELGLSPLGFLRAAADATTSTALPHAALGLPAHQLLSLGFSCPSSVHKHGVNFIAIAGQQLCPAPMTLSGGDALA